MKPAEPSSGAALCEATVFFPMARASESSDGHESVAMAEVRCTRYDGVAEPLVSPPDLAPLVVPRLRQRQRRARPPPALRFEIVGAPDLTDETWHLAVRLAEAIALRLDHQPPSPVVIATGALTDRGRVRAVELFSRRLDSVWQMAALNPAVPHLFLYPSGQTWADVRMTWNATWVTRNFVSLPVEDVSEAITEVLPRLRPRSYWRLLVALVMSIAATVFMCQRWQQ